MPAFVTRLHHRLLPVALLASGVTACAGGSSSGKSTHRAAATGTPPSQIYRVALSGRAEPGGGARSGRGDAIIAFHGDSVMCWRFAHLHGFLDATGAAVVSGAAQGARTVVARLGTGQRLHHQGCTPVTSAVARRIIGRPTAFSVTVASRRNPAGAVGAHL
jgi:hypothetical protein